MRVGGEGVVSCGTENKKECKIYLSFPKSNRGNTLVVKLPLLVDP